MEKFNNSPEKNIKLSDLQPIQKSRGAELLRREDLDNLIEKPLLSACQELYDKNIRTTGSSANYRDIKYGYCHIVIDFDTLSEENKKIGQSLGTVMFTDNTNSLEIKIPVTEESTFGDVQLAAEEIAHKFHKQKYSVIVYTLSELRKFHGIEENNESFGIESFSEQF